MIYKFIIRPILFLFPPEAIHNITFALFQRLPIIGSMVGINRRWLNKHPNLKVNVFGFEFDHPVGLAAGMDKNARILPFLKNSGFAFAEVGTITPRPQPGNPKPRSFRIKKDGALINRMGFNNHGLEGAVRELKNRPSNYIVGGNIGKNTNTSNEDAWKDYLECFNTLYEYVDYFVINVSCPNIKDLSKLQSKESLSEIISHIVESRKSKPITKPVLLKVSPDLSGKQLDELCEVVERFNLDGLVATNTSILRDGLTINSSEIERIGSGGLSGAPLTERSTEVIRYLHNRLGYKFPIIASGGVMKAEDAIQKLEAGAKLVQVYTGYIYSGPGFIRAILKSLIKP